MPVVHDFEPTGLVAVLAEEFGDGVDGDVGEGGGVTFESSERGDFGEETLD